MNTKIEYELKGKEKVLILDILKDHIETGDHNDILNEKVKELFSKLEYCYYDDGDVRKVGFVLFLSNGDKWDNLPFYDQWEVISFGSGMFILPKHLNKPATYQKISEENFVYLYREEGIRADKKECDNLA